jgi:ATP-dependent DNA helicase RecG
VVAGSTDGPLQRPLTSLRGVGPHLAEKLRALGIERVADLLVHLPLRYEDRRRCVPVSALVHNREAQVAARIERHEVRLIGRRQLRVWTLDAADEPLLLRFFHFRNSQSEAFVAGAGIRVWGVARQVVGGWEMVHPEYRLSPRLEDVRPEGGLQPVYPLTAGVTQARLRTLISLALDKAIGDTLMRTPIPGLDAPGGPDTLAALRALHLPADDVDVAALSEGRHPAQHRLIDEELLAHQLSLRMARMRAQDRRTHAISGFDAALETLGARLGFALTGAQSRVIAEIAADMSRPLPMLRLVQGDVGSGKTVVAAAALLATVRAGLQGVLMAPTELLAEQHANTLAGWLAPLGVNVVLVKGGLPAKARAVLDAAIADGSAQLVIGTHAVFQDRVRFDALGLVVIDEQHRFGVRQRLALRDKGSDGSETGSSPHQLVMTATPIPRTLAQTVYADLDVSVIDELPPGRTPIQTAAVANTRRHEVIERLRAACADGRQVYWVCTLIEESDTLSAQAAEEAAELLVAELPALRVGLVHGRMKPAEKAAVMQAFKSGQLDILVATTVIEVGVDVPNASIMVIENAERLGLAQLHQLRGRVGRGHQASQCLLLYQPPLGDIARARLETMRSTHSGFEIAQKDLELRGPGELLGRRQTGLVGLKVADPVRDAARVPRLTAIADACLRDHPELARQLIRRWVGDIEIYGRV